MPTIDATDAVSKVSEQLLQGRCVLFLGSGASAMYKDSLGKVFHGLPTVGGLLDELRDARTYVKNEMSLVEALTMMERNEGRLGLITFIQKHIPSCAGEPLPIHTEISKLPLSAIVTTNWDLYIEEALRRSYVDYHTIARDTDIPMFRTSSVPLVKFHGSIDQSDTIVATTNDHNDIFRKRPLMTSLIRVLCAQGTVLFLGYSLEDPDFKMLFRQLKTELLEFMPASYAVQLAPKENSEAYWSGEGVYIVDTDATGFLRTVNTRLFLESAAKLRRLGDIQEWSTTPFLRELLGAGSLPTEGRAIDGILRQIVQMLDTSSSLEDIEAALGSALGTLVEHRPNYQVLKHLKEDLFPSWFGASSRSRFKIREAAANVLAERERIKTEISQKGASVIESGDRILIYSQSTRVIDALTYYFRANPANSNIELIVCERRHKSPDPVHDARVLAEKVNGFDVPVCLIPDASLAYMMDRQKITKVFLGAHAIYELPERIIFTNTTGTLTIARLAETYGIPVYVLAEEAKIAPLDPDCSIKETFLPQTDHGVPLMNAPSVLQDRMQSHEITYLNPGWDAVSSEDIQFNLITEDRFLVLSP